MHQRYNEVGIITKLWLLQFSKWRLFVQFNPIKTTANNNSLIILPTTDKREKIIFLNRAPSRGCSDIVLNFSRSEMFQSLAEKLTNITEEICQGKRIYLQIIEGSGEIKEN